MLNIIQKRKIWFIFSGIVIIVGIISLGLWGLKLGIDFTGGTLTELGFKEGRPDISEIDKVLEPLELEQAPIRPTGERGILLRTKPLEREEYREIVSRLEDKFGQIEEIRYETVGPTIGKELRKKAIYAISGALVCIVLYVAYAFRKVSKEISSWKLGLCTIGALVHDTFIVLGIFSILGHYFNIEITALFIVALLTILGYSVNDTIVIFDRTRENLLSAKEETFEKTVNKSVNQSLTRSINTSSTTFLVLLAIFLFGGQTIRYFVLALMIGVIVGTYSSIFIASPLLVAWQRLTKRT